MSFAAIGVGVGVAGAAGSIYSASQTGSGTMGPSGAARSTLFGYGNTSPYQLALNQQYQPQYLGLGSQNIQQLLFGSQGSSRNDVVPYWAEKTPGARRAWQNKVTGEITYDNPRSNDWTRVATLSSNIPAQTGLLDIIGQATPRFQQLGIDSANMGRQADLNALQQFQPGYQQQFEQAAPELMALRRQMGLDASQQLALGNQVDPNDAHRISQQVRGDYANRGLGRSNQADLSQALSLYGSGEGLRSQRQGYAGNTANMLAQTQPDYTKFILGQQGSMPQAMQFITGQQPLAYQKQFDPYNPEAMSLVGQKNAATVAGQQAMTSTLGGISGGMFSLAGNQMNGGQQYNTTPGWMAAAGGYRV